MACATSATLLAGDLALPTAANATPIVPLEQSSRVDNVAYRCGEVWSCGRFACGWTNLCGWQREPYSYGSYADTRPHRRWRRHWGYRRSR
jgi:hypothetical protein